MIWPNMMYKISWHCPLNAVIISAGGGEGPSRGDQSLVSPESKFLSSFPSSKTNKKTWKATLFKNDKIKFVADSCDEYINEFPFMI